MSLDSWNEIRSAAERAVRRGNFDEATHHWMQALSACASLDKYDGRRITTLEGLANVYWQTNNFADALPLLEKTFALHEDQLGPDHADIGVLANNLARVHHTLGQFAEAEQLYKRALRIRRKVMGVEHPEVVELVNNYANLLVASGKAFEAEDLRASTVSIKSGVWNRSGYFKTIQLDSQDSLFAGVESSLTAPSSPSAPQADSAGLLNSTLDMWDSPTPDQLNGVMQGQFIGSAPPQLPGDSGFQNNSNQFVQPAQEMQSVHQTQSTEDVGTTTGADPSTITDAEKSAESNELSNWLSSRKGSAPQVTPEQKPETWQELFAKSLEAIQQNNNLQAEHLLKKAVVLADDFELTDPRTASTLELYSEALWKNGKLAEAEPICERTLHIYATTLEPNHQDIGVVANNLAMLYHALDKPEKAEPLYKRALEIRSKNQGASHPDVVMLLNNYANMLYISHREGEAVNLKNHIRSLSSGKWNQVGKFKALSPLQAPAAESREQQSQTFSKFKPSMGQMLRTSQPDDLHSDEIESKEVASERRNDSAAESNTGYSNDPRAVLKNLVDGFKKKPTD